MSESTSAARTGWRPAWERDPPDANQTETVALAPPAAEPDSIEFWRRFKAKLEARAAVPVVPSAVPARDGEWSAERRAVAYLEKVDPAISGQDGSGTTFRAACSIGPGFNLDPEVAYRLLRDHYSPRCVPPWSERELRHKVDDAYKVETRRGWLLADGRGDGGRGEASSRAAVALKPAEREEPARLRGDRPDSPPVGALEPADLASASDYAALSDADLGIIGLGDVEAEPVEWLWPYRLARKELALVAGEGGLGKSQILLSIASAISTGGEWPDKSGRAPIGRVIILAAEDDPGTTIKPRLMAMGADVSRVTILTARCTIQRPGKPPLVSPVSLQDIRYWQAVFDRLSDTRLLIVDPLPSYLGRGVNDSKNNELRAAVEPFINQVTRPRGVCVLANSHLNKSSGAQSPLHRINGSVAYANLARNVHFVIRDPDDPSHRIFKQAKCNNAPDDLPAIGFRVERREVSSNRGPIETAVPVFDAETMTVDLAEAMTTDPSAKKRGPAPANASKLAVFLVEFLKGRGPVHLAEIGDAAGEAGHLGTLGADGRYKAFTALYRAVKLVPTLPAPHEGWIVATSKDDPGLLSPTGKARWALRSAESPY